MILENGVQAASQLVKYILMVNWGGHFAVKYLSKILDKVFQ